MDFNERIKMLDNTFSLFMMNSIKESVFTKGISDILTAIAENDEVIDTKTYEVQIVNNTKEPFFGFRIFPAIEECMSLTHSILYKRQPYATLVDQWSKIKEWVVEIDNTIFDRQMITLIPSELTALLLHEMSKTIYSEVVFERVYGAFKEAYMPTTYEEKQDMRTMHMLYAIPITKSCMIREWMINATEINMEPYSISLINLANYIENFITGVGKIVKVFGNSIMKDTEFQDDTILESITWCNLMSKDFIKRKNKLKDDILYRTFLSSSYYLRALSLKLLYDLGVGLREVYTGATMDCTSDVIDSEDFLEAYESFFMDLRKLSIYETQILNKSLAFESLRASRQKNTKLKPPSQYDIDAIAVEIDRITNHHDRIYILDLIYKMIEELDEFTDIMNADKEYELKYKTRIDSMYKQLEAMRKEVLSKKSFDKTYKVFVKVPKEYEG